MKTRGKYAFFPSFFDSLNFVKQGPCIYLLIYHTVIRRQCLFSRIFVLKRKIRPPVEKLLSSKTFICINFCICPVVEKYKNSIFRKINFLLIQLIDHIYVIKSGIKLRAVRILKKLNINDVIFITN